MPAAEDVQNVNKYQYWDINSGMFFPQQFSISLSAAKSVDMTMRKDVPLMLISLVVFSESQLSALPFVMLVLLQSKSRLFLLLQSLDCC